MRSWFLNLTQRERIILVAGLALAFVCLIWMLLVPSFRNAHADARHRLAEAIRADEASIAAKSNLASGRLRPKPVGLSAARQRQVMIDAAANRGLTVSRLQTPDDSSILFQFEKVSSSALFSWLEDLEEQLGQEPVQAMIEASESGGVRASVEFKVESGT